VARDRARLRRLFRDRPGSPDSAAGTPASKLCSPRESVLTSDRRPGQGAIAWSVLSWAFFPSRAFSGRPLGSVFARTNVVGTDPCLVRPRELTAWPRVFARSVLRSWGLEPTIRRRARSIEPVTSPSGSDPARARFREAPARRSPASPRAAWEELAPLFRPPCGETCCPRPLSAAPRASRVLGRAPPGGRARLDLGDARYRVASRPTPCEAGQLLWGFAPRRACS
jgi:hypothetical protein